MVAVFGIFLAETAKKLRKAQVDEISASEEGYRRWTAREKGRGIYLEKLGGVGR